MQLFGFIRLDFLTSVQGALFSHFNSSYFLWGKKKIARVREVDKLNKAPHSSDMFFCQLRTKNTHTMNHLPTAPGLCNMTAH